MKIEIENKYFQILRSFKTERKACRGYCGIIAANKKTRQNTF
jgi:hypothetical protein